MTETAGQQRRGWLGRLRDGLTRSSSRLTSDIGAVFTKRRLDDQALEELEEILIAADLGPSTAAKLAAAFGRKRFGQEVTAAEVRGALAEEIAAMLEPVARPLDLAAGPRPYVILVVGVNGTGKTTTIGKLAHWLADKSVTPMLCAGDTFRAAAIEQLEVWGERVGAPVVTGRPGADPAGLAYEALERARAEAVDALLIDTAGRLHNKKDLMAELEKIVRVLRKLDPTAPHSCLLVLDATTGQNAVAQAATFREVADITGLVVTKLDGSAKGGVLVALAEKFGLPVHAIGVGEGIDDLRPFDARSFARELMGLDG